MFRPLRSGWEGKIPALNEDFPETLHQEPCGSLTNIDFPMQLHAGTPLDPGGHHAEHDSPIRYSEFAGLQDYCLADGDLLAAFRQWHGIGLRPAAVAVFVEPQSG